MSKKHPVVENTEMVEVSRVARLSLNDPCKQVMSLGEALAGKVFDTSHGTMSVHVVVMTGLHAGATLYLDGKVARAQYEPSFESPRGDPLF